MGERGRRKPAILLHEHVERQARLRPEHPAVAMEGRSLTYFELDRRAGLLARDLRARGMGPESVVGIFMERSPEMVVALLGILGAGAAYLPLDPRHPRDRLAFMTGDAGAGLVLTGGELAARLPSGLPTFALDREWEGLGGEPAEPFKSGTTPDHLAYVMYTSGSTGRPKGALVLHRGVANLIAAQREVGLSGPESRVLQFSPLSFDASVYEIAMSLAVGGTLHLARQTSLLPGPELVELLRRERITHMMIPPSVLAALPAELAAHEKLTDLTTILVAGEACPASLVERWAPGRRFINAYGPAETTVWASYAEWRSGRRPNGGEKPPIGRPIHGFRLDVRRRDLRPVEDGESGELCIAGMGLGRGYMARPGQTARQFVPDPASPEPGGRLYRSGDLARWLDGGTLDFVGRVDHQTKVRGQRLELGEVEAVLDRHPTVVRNVVVAREDASGERRLVAYVVPKDAVAGDAAAEGTMAAALRRHLREFLPDYMVPAAFVVLSELPLTANGKIDREALPEPRAGRAEAGEYVAPRHPTEALVAEIAGRLLGVEEIGIHDHFFALGGNSLLATRLTMELRRAFNVTLPLERVFEALTVAELAELVARPTALEETAPIPALPRDGRPLPLSFSQERVWFVQQMTPDAAAYHASSCIEWRGELDVAVLEEALSEIVRRHEILRTTFPEVGGEPRQEIHPPWPVRLPRLDLLALPAAERDAAARRFIAEEVRRPFDMTRLPLVRWSLLRRAPRHHTLVQVEHHLVHDGWSFNVLLGETVRLYRSCRVQEPPRLAELPIQFADFAAFQRRWAKGPEAARQLEFWRRELRGVPPLELPTDRPRPAVMTHAGKVLPITLHSELADGIRRRAQEAGGTLFMTLFTVFAALIHRWSGQGDFAIGSGIANRRWPETENLLGMIINNLVLRLDFAALERRDTRFGALFERVREVALRAYAHQDLPFDRIVDALQPERDPSRNPIFQVAFSFHDSPLIELEIEGLELETEVAISSGSAKFDLNIVTIPQHEQHLGRQTDGMEPDEASVVMLFEFNTDLFDDTTLARLVAAYERWLERLVDDPQCDLLSEPLLSAAGRHQVLVEWNDTPSTDLGERPVHELFAEHAARRPAAPAAVGKEMSLSYGELQQQAAAWRRRLRELGLGRGDRVAIFTPSRPEMVVGMIAALECGAAYLPLDPAYPAERVAFILEDSGAAALLTVEAMTAALPPTSLPILFLDAPPQGSDPLSSSGGEGVCAVSLADRAYVIYTSGSTGRPKGVEISHGGLLNLVRWHQREYEVVPADRATQLASPAFDATVWEIWPYLAAGACMYFPAADVRASPSDLVEYFAAHEITLSFAPTPLAEAMLDETWPAKAAPRAFLTGGDRLTRARQEGQPPLFNHYGPTENSVVASWCPVGGSQGPPPIGRPLDNVRLYVLDRRLRPAALGAPGELAIGGASLARGYLRRPAWTAEAFVPDPFAERAGERLYRTGDLVRHGRDGQIDFLGRADHQVKIRGFRIELGELEAVLERHEKVRDAAAVVSHELPGGPQLVAYVVLREAVDETTDEALLEGAREELSRFLRDRLPPYMVPEFLVFLPELPLNPHGKVDRRSLPAPDPAGRQRAAAVAPRTPTEERIAAICAEWLGLSSVGVEDGFFGLGGNSLLATRVLSRVRRAFRVELPLHLFMQEPTIAALARHVDARLASDTAPGDTAPRRAADDEISRLAWRDADGMLERLDELSDAEVEALLEEMQP